MANLKIVLIVKVGMRIVAKGGRKSEDKSTGMGKTRPFLNRLLYRTTRDTAPFAAVGYDGLVARGFTQYHAWPQPYDHRPSRPYNDGTEHVGFSPTRQTFACTKREAP